MLIYLNQAATSYPKPKVVIDEMVRVLTSISGNPGRGEASHIRSASTILQETRENLKEVFGMSNARKAIFFENATVALNQAIKGVKWEIDDHVITTTFEHNSVRRPLHVIEQNENIEVTYVNPLKEKDIVKAFQNQMTQRTKAIIMTHACNVTGDVLPIEKIGRLAKKNNVLFIIDGAQSVGHLPIHMEEYGINMLAFPAHKSLRGPQGLGVLLVEGDIALQPIHHGGTGTKSEQIEQPKEWPTGYESGTLNIPAIAGLRAALTNHEKFYEENVSRETFLMEKLKDSLQEIEEIKIYDRLANKNIPIIAFNILDISSHEIATILETHYNIIVRAGIHCNPLCHETYGTLDQGMIRVSVNASNTKEEIQQFLLAIKEIVASYSALSE